MDVENVFLLLNLRGDEHVLNVGDVNVTALDDTWRFRDRILLPSGQVDVSENPNFLFEKAICVEIKAFFSFQFTMGPIDVFGLFCWDQLQRTQFSMFRDG